MNINILKESGHNPRTSCIENNRDLHHWLTVLDEIVDDAPKAIKEQTAFEFDIILVHLV